VKFRLATALVTAVAGTLATIAGTAHAAEPAIIATVAVHTADDRSETFRMLIEESWVIEQVRANFAGTENTFPIGTIVYGQGPAENTGYTWHLRNVSMTDLATEVCDGLPSYVEKHQVTSPYYCPWGAKVIAIEPAA
jgi:hypothetical protein